MYSILRALAALALRWYYRDIQVDGIERLPRQRPLLLAVNHPNALVDALLVGCVVPRRVMITAKSTLFANPIGGALLRWVGVVPLRRAADEADVTDRPNPARNRGTFEAVHDALRHGGAVLVFPEGITHDEPSLAPLKTGAARMALHCRKAGDVPDLAIVPIGLTFERKEAPRTRVLVRVGEPIVVSDWTPPTGVAPAAAMTAEIETRLRAVTANYASSDDAARAVHLASLIASMFDDAPAIGAAGRSLGVEAAIARRVDRIERALRAGDQVLAAQARALEERLEAFGREVKSRGILIEDVAISRDLTPGVRFTLREGWLLLIGGPIALWGRLNHWLPIRAARAVAMRSIDSAADPAMRTLVAGTAFVLLTYIAQTAIVYALWGGGIALAYFVSLPIAGDLNFALSDRVRRARRRARAYLAFRRDPGLQQRWLRELEELRVSVVRLDRAFSAARSDSRAQ
ncbi:MAG TPA: lysophospholipid acyltransferase family protein [Gemmatimonadaceae bacterium]|nr:lysophospholipid acyltransferase family protein [Gemmatimonadaceae bacterium]